MSKILVIGNILKDNYVRLDPNDDQVFKDKKGHYHINLSFDASSHPFHSSFAVYGGAAVTIDVLRNFGLSPQFTNLPEIALGEDTYDYSKVNPVSRFILCCEDQVSYLCPSQITAALWQDPSGTFDALYLDRSTSLSPGLISNLNKYLDQNPNTKFYFFVSRLLNQHDPQIQELIERSDFLISDTELQSRQPELKISQNRIQYRGLSVSWPLREKQDLLTHLTAHLIIASSIVASEELSFDPEQAILLAHANLASSTLSGSKLLDELELELLEGSHTASVKQQEKEDDLSEIHTNAKKLVAFPKGILAADESGGSINRKFSKLSIEDNEQNRRDYRNLFFTTPQLEEYVNGVILFDETARQFADDGDNFMEFLAKKGIIPGIKVDQGLENFPNSTEVYTKGLEDLPARLDEYYKMGARFAKWRAAFEVGDTTPSSHAIAKNAQILAKYAKYCQSASIVPIVEPELVYDGNYSIEKSIYFTGKILDQLFAELQAIKVDVSACILKVNMVLAGKQYHARSTPLEVGEATAQVLRKHLPEDLAGVVFLSGGQSVEQATDNLQAITNAGPFPWPVTFSFARALQDPALFAWQGNNKNASAAREAFRLRLVANASALHQQN